MFTDFAYLNSNKAEPIAYYFYQKNDKDGEAIPLVFIHGFCEDSTIWEPFFEVLSQKTKNTLLAIDIGSFGASSLNDTSIKQMAMQIKTVLDSLQLPKCLLIGHSMGGYAALAAAELYPQQLAGIGLLHSHVFADSAEKKDNRNKSIDFIARNGVAPFAKQLFYQLFEPDFARANTTLVEDLVAKARVFSPEAIMAASAAMRDRADSSAVLQNFGKPILFISGKQDNTITVQQSLAQAALANTAYFLWLEKVGHMAIFEAPEKVATALQTFLSAIGE